MFFIFIKIIIFVESVRFYDIIWCKWQEGTDLNTKEIKEQANFLYQKSSHYISGIFLMVGSILGILGGFSYFIPFMVLTVLMETLEVGAVRASLKAYDRKAKEVSTLKYTFMGIKEYPSTFSVFVGKRLIILIIQVLIILGFMVAFSGSVEQVFACVRAILTGSIDFIKTSDQNNVIQWLIPAGLIIGFGVAMIVGLFLEIKFALTYYYAVDKDYSLFESLSASWKGMKGRTWSYIGLLFRFAFPYIGALVVITLANLALTNGFTQLISMLPAMKWILASVMTVLIAIASTTFAVMFYKVKLQLAITIFYKNVVKNNEEE